MKEVTPLAEKLFARALLGVEPEKFIVCGSRERRDWLELVLTIQAYLHEHNLNADIFKEELLK